MKILFVGGGTLGPVTPLLAVARAIKRARPDATFVWIGTPTGPEAVVIRAEGIEFHSLPVVKWPRYVSWRWLTFPFDWARVRGMARVLVRKLAPDAVVSAGGFTSVPVIRAAAKDGIPCFVHQLDVEPGLANKLAAKYATSVTTSFEYERPPFGEWVSDEWIPTPTRFQLEHLPERASAAKAFSLDPKRPIVLVVGGGTGAGALNEMVKRTRSRWLAFAQIVHVTGLGKNKQADVPGYAVRPFLDADMMRKAYAAADLVVARAGLGGLLEIAALKKSAILVPIPRSQQESNARAFESHGAVIMFSQECATFDDDLLTAARLLLNDGEERKAMGERAHAFLPTDDGTMLAKRVLNVLKVKAVAHGA